MMRLGLGFTSKGGGDKDDIRFSFKEKYIIRCVKELIDFDFEIGCSHDEFSLCQL